jgi:hypothetical protein
MTVDEMKALVKLAGYTAEPQYNSRRELATWRLTRESDQQSFVHLTPPLHTIEDYSGLLENFMETINAEREGRGVNPDYWS